MKISNRSVLSHLGVTLIFLLFISDIYARPYIPSNPSWDETNISAAFDPDNRRGQNPVYQSSGAASALGTLRQSLQDNGGAGSANFQFTVPVVSLAGRGIDLSLALHYNSRLWNGVMKDNTVWPYSPPKVKKMFFDADGDWPSPGWSLGFGKFVRFGELGLGMLIGADGTKHEFIKTEPNSPTSTFHTKDGSLIDYKWISTTYAQVRYPDGMVVDFLTKNTTASTLYPVKIMDANGNYITIKYRNNTGPALDTVTDTLGRVIQFYYDQNKRLTAIEGPGLYGGKRTSIRLHYSKLTLKYRFQTAMVDDDHPPPENIDIIDAIVYPDTKNGYWFGQPDSFSTYGMLRKITEQRGITLNASSLTEQGTISAGETTRERIYNYPISPDSNPLKDAPIYDRMSEY